ncbi:MAG: TolC family protein [Syntrophales bacterium]|jgi:outer membrane protein
MQTKNMHLIFSAMIALLSITYETALSAERLTLGQSIDLALRQSVLVQSAQEGVKGAEAQKREAFTGFLPKFSTYYSYSRLSVDPTLSGNLPFVGPVTLVTGTKDNYSWAVEVKQPIFAGGGILANYEAGRIGHEIAALDETSVVADLVQEVRVAYFNVLKAEKSLDVARQSVQQLESHRSMAQDFFDVGVIPKNDLLRAEVELANSRQNLVKAENAVEMAKAKFNTVLRREIDTPTEVEDILALRPYTKTFDECQKLAIENRPEVKSYVRKVEQSEKLVKLAKSEYLPSVNVVGHFERYGDNANVNGSPYRNSDNSYVMGMATWNFWEWGRTKNRVDASRSRQNQTAYALDNIKDQVSLDVKNTWLALHEAEKQVAVTEKSIEQADENFRVSTERYKEHVGTSTDVIDAQTLLTKAKTDYFNALSDYNISIARLERAMGVREVLP